MYHLSDCAILKGDIECTCMFGAEPEEKEGWENEDDVRATKQLAEYVQALCLRANIKAEGLHEGDDTYWVEYRFPVTFAGRDFQVTVTLS